MSEEIIVFSQEKEKIILEKTPKKFIKQRQGRGGLVLDYVETGYVINTLNKLCNYNWSFQIVNKERIENQIVVHGRLILHSNRNEIIKENFGSAEVKLTKEGKIIDIADDYKAAASDCLKKCASMVGIAQDVYWKQEFKEAKNVVETEKEKLIKQIHIVFNALKNEMKLDNTEALKLYKEILQQNFNVTSSKQLDEKQLNELIKIFQDELKLAKETKIKEVLE